MKRIKETEKEEKTALAQVSGDLYPEKNSIEKGLKKLPQVDTDEPYTGEAEKKDEETFKKTLSTILSLVISPSTVAQAVKSTPLGEKITYQEAILIAQVLKASNGDTQAAVFILDTSGNKLKDSVQDTEEKRTFESLEDFDA